MQPPSQIDHLGIAVHSIEDASRLYVDALGLTCDGIEEIPDQKVKVALFQVGEVRIELVEPTDDDSPIRKFLDKRGSGLHHIAYRVTDLSAVLDELEASGVRLIDQVPREGAHGMKIAFAHPDATGGALVEFCQPG